MQVEFITIEKAELVRLIDASVTTAIERVLSRPDEVLSKQAVADYLQVSVATITRYMSKGLPRLKGGRPKFRRSEVDRWIASN